jgi:hypothetical protein
MPLATLLLNHDYLVLSLSAIRAPVVVIERPVISIQVVEGLQGTLTEEDGFGSAVMTEVEDFAAAVVEEEQMSASVETEDMAAVMSSFEELDGVFWECDK